VDELLSLWTQCRRCQGYRPAVAANSWDAERVVDPEQAAEVIRAQFPPLGGRPVRLLGVGWDNTVYAVDDGFVFRFPRRAQALAGIRREIAVLPWLAPQLPLAIPRPTFVGELDDWPFWGAALVPGAEIAGRPDEERTAAAAAAGAFLRTLHDLTPPAELQALLALDPMRRGDPDHRMATAREWLARLEPAATVDVEPLFEQATGLAPSPAYPRLSHGDLHVRHLLVDETTATGVIDWGDVCLADPAVDLSLGYAAFLGRPRAAFLTAYGDVDRDTELRARVLAVSLCTMLAASVPDGALRREAMRGIERAVA
jgi:aminoglycoside phosphotransferase (APT) family kinase protein